LFVRVDITIVYCIQFVFHARIVGTQSL